MLCYDQDQASAVAPEGVWCDVCLFTQEAQPLANAIEIANGPKPSKKVETTNAFLC